MTQEQTRVHVRWMIRRDLAEVFAIEAGSFTEAWTEDDFLRCLRQRNCIGMVAADAADRIVGFMIYELSKPRLTVVNFAVHPSFRRSGIGSAMVAKLIGKLSSHRRPVLTLTVTERNVEAQLFFRRCGFVAVGVDRNAYGSDSGYKLEYRIGPDIEVDSSTNRISQFEDHA